RHDGLRGGVRADGEALPGGDAVPVRRSRVRWRNRAAGPQIPSRHVRTAHWRVPQLGVMVNTAFSRSADQAGRAGPPSSTVDFLSLWGAANRRRLLQGSARVVQPAGTIALRLKGPAMTYLVESVLGRAFWSLPDGRQPTVAIVRPKELVGATVSLGYAPWLFMQTITESTLIT